MRCPISDRGGPTLYVGLGGRLLAYAVGIEHFMLTPIHDSTTLPANVQYACPHASGRHLYVVSSNGGPGIAGDAHYLTAFQIDRKTSALTQQGDHVRLHSRPIHITTDAHSDHALIAYNEPSAVSVHSIQPDGSVGGEVPQLHQVDAGVFAHEIRITPSNHTAIVVARGNDAKGDRPEDPGALKVLDYRDGVLARRASVAPTGGYGFGPRNLDFHPSSNWLYVSLERQNKLATFKFDGATIEPVPSFECGTLNDSIDAASAQMAGAVRVHPSGRFVYVANRASTGGENSIAVFEIHDSTGEPRRVQSIDSQGIHPRTFSIDPAGKVMVVGNSKVRPNVSVFAIGEDGRLRYQRNYDFERTHELFWSGLVA